MKNKNIIIPKKPKNYISAIATAFILLVVSDLAGASVIASFNADYQGPTPKPGWSYLWNSLGAIGDPANYTPLLWEGGFYDSDGVTGPGSGLGSYVRLYANGGHPGPGGYQGVNPDRYAIAAYTLSADGNIMITDSLLQVPAAGAGVDLRVYVNSSLRKDILSNSTLITNFDISLGNLSAGDTVYVAIGPNGDYINDSFSLNYSLAPVSLAPVPLPSTLSLFFLGILGLLGFGWRPPEVKAEIRKNTGF